MPAFGNLTQAGKDQGRQLSGIDKATGLYAHNGQRGTHRLTMEMASLRVFHVAGTSPYCSLWRTDPGCQRSATAFGSSSLPAGKNAAAIQTSSSDRREKFSRFGGTVDEKATNHPPPSAMIALSQTSSPQGGFGRSGSIIMSRQAGNQRLCSSIRPEG